MHILENGVITVNIDPIGANVITLYKGGKQIFYPKRTFKKKDRDITRGGMHICSPVFGSPEGKGMFESAPQHGELRNLRWRKTSEEQDYETDLFVISYEHEYRLHDTSLDYQVIYRLRDNCFAVRTFIRNRGNKDVSLELGWHPYFYAPNGALFRMGDTCTRQIKVSGEYPANVIEGCRNVSIELCDLAQVNIFMTGSMAPDHFCIWTDWLDTYVCGEPLLSYKESSIRKSVKVKTGERIIADIYMYID